MIMSDNVVANLKTPAPILQQTKSTIVTTNPFIPNEQREIEISSIQNQANSIIEDAYNSNKTASLQNLTLSEINYNISSSFTGFIDDIFAKPQDLSWRHYLPIIIQKDQRFAYLGILLVFIAIYMLLARN